MRQKLKLITFAALSAALTVTGLSIAAGGGDSRSSSDRSGDGPHFVHRGELRHLPFDRDVAEVLREIHRAVAKKAPEIAGPIIQEAEDAGDITSDQADKLRDAAQAIADGKRPDADTRELHRDADVREVVRKAFEAAADQAPGLAEPILDKAVEDKKISEAEANQIRERLKDGPRLGFGRGCGPGGPGGRPHFERGRSERPEGVPGAFPAAPPPAAAAFAG